MPPGKAHLQSAPVPPGSPASPEDYERMVQEVCMFSSFSHSAMGEDCGCLWGTSNAHQASCSFCEPDGCRGGAVAALHRSDHSMRGLSALPARLHTFACQQQGSKQSCSLCGSAMRRWRHRRARMRERWHLCGAGSPAPSARPSALTVCACIARNVGVDAGSPRSLQGLAACVMWFGELEVRVVLQWWLSGPMHPPECTVRGCVSP